MKIEFSRSIFGAWNRIAWIGKTIQTLGMGQQKPNKMLLDGTQSTAVTWTYAYDHRIDAMDGVGLTLQSEASALRGAICEMQASQRQANVTCRAFQRHERVTGTPIERVDGEVASAELAHYPMIMTKCQGRITIRDVLKRISVD